MKILNMKIYKCEYCGKRMFGKGAMVIHERMCNKNPKNRHMCFKYCKHLDRVPNELVDEYGDSYNGGSKFICKKTGKEMYSYKLERFKKNEYRKKNKTRMPLKCDFYEIGNGHEDDFIQKILSENI